MNRRVWLIYWWDICDQRDDEEELVAGMIEYVDLGWACTSIFGNSIGKG